MCGVCCCPAVLQAGKEGQYESEGYGQRPYDNWDKIMFECEGQVRGLACGKVALRSPAGALH